jgi:hypothetical protein
MEWFSVKERLPKFGEGGFIAWWENQNVMLMCHCDIHGNYIISDSSGDICGHGE